ncbi:ORMDL family [Chytriomyces sp. MP71]|nr:ORMDL family [Chytriomyces sp. MP71]
MESFTNSNSSWPNLRGSIATNVFVLFLIRLGLGLIPGMTAEAAWTITSILYDSITFLMFHWILGVPFALNQGDFEDLTLWEQMDKGEPFTPAKKYLTIIPIILFLLGTHYSHYNVPTFTINLIALVIVLIPKFPAMYKVRIFGINQKPHTD